MNRVVRTENGLIRGLPASDPRITSFKGIPFAAPPMGENRWRAPQPCQDWEGELKAYEFGPISMQDKGKPGRDNFWSREWAVDFDLPMSEDCLYLNVWAPADGYAVGDAEQYRKHEDDPVKRPGNLPVFVWFFGGGLQVGNTAEMEFDGERIARRGVVVVTVNYRLNAFGFLSHPDLTREDPSAPANFGFLDQQFAMKWVKRNIAAFGGDPGNITIGGQSSGGMSVCVHLANPANRGLFRRAVLESAVFIPAYAPKFIFGTDLAGGEEHGKVFLEKLGVRTIEEARKIPAEVRAERDPRAHAGTLAESANTATASDSSAPMIALRIVLEISPIASVISAELISMARGSPRRESLPFKRKLRSTFGSLAQAIASLQDFAIALPMMRPCFLRTYLMISSSIALPAVLMVLLTDIPPSDITAISIVPAPMSTTIQP